MLKRSWFYHFVPTLYPLVLGLLSLNTYANSGANSGGGGDAVCEAAIKRMIYGGGPQLPGIQQFIDEGIAFENEKGPKQGSAELGSMVRDFDLHKYDQGMKSAIDSLSWDLAQSSWNLHSVSCIADQALVRWPEGSKDPKDNKICIAHYLDQQNQAEPQILCYSGESIQGTYHGGLMGMNGPQQFQQMHHELAVLGKLEDEPGQLDNYPFSRFVGEFTEARTFWVMSPYAKASAHAAPSDFLGMEIYPVAFCKDSASSTRISIHRFNALNDTKDHRQRPEGQQLGVMVMNSEGEDMGGMPVAVEYVRDPQDPRVVSYVSIEAKGEASQVLFSIKLDYLALIGATNPPAKASFMGKNWDCSSTEHLAF